jgi:hypothetical protein
MTREEHLDLWKEYSEKSTTALGKCVENFNKTDWEEYLKYYKLANKEFGIASAMHTKAMKKIKYSLL